MVNEVKPCLIFIDQDVEDIDVSIVFAYVQDNIPETDIVVITQGEGNTPTRQSGALIWKQPISTEDLKALIQKMQQSG